MEEESAREPKENVNDKLTSNWEQSVAKVYVIPGEWDGSGLEPSSSSSQVFLPEKEKGPYRWDPGAYWDVGEIRGWPERRRLLPSSERHDCIRTA